MSFRPTRVMRAVTDSSGVRPPSSRLASVLEIGMRFHPVANTGVVYSDDAGLKKIDAEVCRTGAVVYKQKPHLVRGIDGAPGFGSADEVEELLKTRIREGVVRAIPDLYRDLAGLDESGYLTHDIELDLASSDLLGPVGYVSAKLRVSKSAQFVYSIRVDVYTAQFAAPYDAVTAKGVVAAQSYDTGVIDLRSLFLTPLNLVDELSVLQRRTPALSEKEMNVEVMKIMNERYKEWVEVTEAISGMPIEPFIMNREEIEIFPAPYLQSVKDALKNGTYETPEQREAAWRGRLANDVRYAKADAFVKLVIEVEKAYYNSVLMLLYQPEQVLAALSRYEAIGLFNRSPV